jgi:hypothetical protein
MRAWTETALGKITAAEQLELASVRRNGTLRHPVTMWASGRPGRPSQEAIPDEYL